MKILLICGSFPPMACGVGDYTAKLAEALAKQPGLSVAVLTDKAAGGVAGARYDLFPVVRRWNLASLPAIVKVVRALRPDIIHVQFPAHAYGRKLFPWLLPSLLLPFGRATAQTWHEYYATTPASLRNILNAVIPGAIVVVRPRYREVMPSWHRRLIRDKRVLFIPNASSIPPVRLEPSERNAIHGQFASPGKALLVYFGFVYPHKGVELIFDIADPARHHLVFVGDIRESDPYHRAILERIRRGPWAGSVTTTGFLPPEETARILSAADAVVLPFRDGGGIWNTSLHGAAIQGTFVLTTSNAEHGYDEVHNMYFARPGDLAEMRQALAAHLGRRNSSENIRHYATWDSIAEEHRALYQGLLA